MALSCSVGAIAGPVVLAFAAPRAEAAGSHTPRSCDAFELGPCIHTQDGRVAQGAASKATGIQGSPLVEVHLLQRTDRTSLLGSPFDPCHPSNPSDPFETWSWLLALHKAFKRYPKAYTGAGT